LSLPSNAHCNAGCFCCRFAVQFYKCQLAQLQRQVVLLQTELRARNKLVREAETMLLECLTQIEPLVNLAPSSRGPKATSSSGKASSRAQQQQAAAEFDPAAWQQLCSWSQKMLGRLKRSRAEAAALLSKQTAGNGTGDWSSSGGKQRWDVDYVPAGGNRSVREGRIAQHQHFTDMWCCATRHSISTCSMPAGDDISDVPCTHSPAS
jgi:hypothetical protein